MMASGQAKEELLEQIIKSNHSVWHSDSEIIPIKYTHNFTADPTIGSSGSRGSVCSVVALAARRPAPIVGPTASAAAVLEVAVITATAASPREVAAASGVVVRTVVGSRIEVRIRSRLIPPFSAQFLACSPCRPWFLVSDSQSLCVRLRPEPPPPPPPACKDPLGLVVS